MALIPNKFTIETNKITVCGIPFSFKNSDNIENFVHKLNDILNKLDTFQIQLVKLKDDLQSTISEDEDKRPTQLISFKDDFNIHFVIEKQYSYLQEEMKRLSGRNQIKIQRWDRPNLMYYFNQNLQSQRDHVESHRENMISENLICIPELIRQTSSYEFRNQTSFVDAAIYQNTMLRQEVKELERALSAYHDLPSDIEILKKKALLLNEVVKDRDRLAGRIEHMRKVNKEVKHLKLKADKAEEIERQLQLAKKDIRYSKQEIDSCKETYARSESELLKQKIRSNRFKSRIACMQYETQALKAVCKEKDFLQVENQRLKNQLNQIFDVQNNIENTWLLRKESDILRMERDMYRKKFEHILTLSNDWNILRNQLKDVGRLEYEKYELVKQISNLTSHNSRQENEINKLLQYVENISVRKDETEMKIKQALSDMRQEIYEKHNLLLVCKYVMNHLKQKIVKLINHIIQGTENANLNDKSLQNLRRQFQNSKMHFSRKNKFITQDVHKFPGMNSKVNNEFHLTQKASKVNNLKQLPHTKRKYTKKWKLILMVKKQNASGGAINNNKFHLECTSSNKDQYHRAKMGKLFMELKRQNKGIQMRKINRITKVNSNNDSLIIRKQKNEIIDSRHFRNRSLTADFSKFSWPKQINFGNDRFQKYIELPSSILVKNKKIRKLQEKLTKANRTIYQLKDKLFLTKRLSVETIVLSVHSIEMQESAKRQMKQIIKHLNRAHNRISELEEMRNSHSLGTSTSRDSKDWMTMLNSHHFLTGENIACSDTSDKVILSESNLNKSKVALHKNFKVILFLLSLRIAQLESEFQSLSKKQDKSKLENDKLKNINQEMIHNANRNFENQAEDKMHLMQYLKQPMFPKKDSTSVQEDKNLSNNLCKRMQNKNIVISIINNINKQIESISTVKNQLPLNKASGGCIKKLHVLANEIRSIQRKSNAMEASLLSSDLRTISNSRKQIFSKERLKKKTDNYNFNKDLSSGYITLGQSSQSRMGEIEKSTEKLSALIENTIQKRQNLNFVNAHSSTEANQTSRCVIAKLMSQSSSRKGSDDPNSSILTDDLTSELKMIRKPTSDARCKTAQVLQAMRTTAKQEVDIETILKGGERCKCKCKPLRPVSLLSETAANIDQINKKPCRVLKETHAGKERITSLQRNIDALKQKIAKMGYKCVRRTDVSKKIELETEDASIITTIKSENEDMNNKNLLLESEVNKLCTLLDCTMLKSRPPTKHICRASFKLSRCPQTTGELPSTPLSQKESSDTEQSIQEPEIEVPIIEPESQIESETDVDLKMEVSVEEIDIPTESSESLDNVELSQYEIIEELEKVQSLPEVKLPSAEMSYSAVVESPEEAGPVEEIVSLPDLSPEIIPELEPIIEEKPEIVELPPKAEKSIEKLKEQTKQLEPQPVVIDPVVHTVDNDEEWQRRLNELLEENSKLKGQLDEALKELRLCDDIKKNNEMLTRELSELQKNCEMLEDKLKQVPKEVPVKEKPLEKVDKPISKFQVQHVQTQTDVLKDVEAERENEKLEWQKKLDELQAQLKQRNQEIERLKDNISDLSNKIKETKPPPPVPIITEPKKIDQSDENQKLKDLIESLKNELANCKTYLSSKSSEFKKLKLENTNLENKLKLSESKPKSTEHKQVGTDKIEPIVIEPTGKVNEAELADYKNKIKELESMLANQKLKCREEIDAIKVQFEKDIEKLLKMNEDNIAKLQKTHEDDMKKLMKLNEDKIAELKKAHDDDMKKLIKLNEDKIAKLQQAHDDDLKKLLKLNEDKIAELKKAHDDDMKKLIKLNEGKIASLQKAHDDDMKKLLKLNEDKLAELKKAHDDDMKKLTKLNDDKIAELLMPHDKDTKKLTQLNDDKIAKLQKAHDDDMKKLLKLNEDKIAELKKAHDDDMKKLTKLNDDKIANLQNAHNDDMKKLLKLNEDKLAELKKTHDDDMKKLTKLNDDKIAELLMPHDKDTKKVTKLNDDKIAKLQKAHDDDMKKLLKLNEDKLAELKKVHDDAMKKVTKLNEDKLAELKKAHDDDMKKLTKLNEDKIAELKKAHDDDMKKLTKLNEDKIAELRKPHDEDMNKLAKLNDDKIAGIRKACDEDKKKLMKMNEDKIAKLQKACDEDKKTLMKMNEDKIAEFRKMHDEDIKNMELNDPIEKSVEPIKEISEPQLESILSEQLELPPITDEPSQDSYTEVLMGDEPYLAEESYEKVSMKDEINLAQESIEKVVLRDEATETDTVAEKDEKPPNDELRPVCECVVAFPDVIPISIPLLEKVSKCYRNTLCPCSQNMYEILRRAATKGMQALAMEELKLIHEHIGNAASSILYKVSKKCGKGYIRKLGAHLSIFKRIAILEENLVRKHKHAQKKSR